MTRRRRNDSKRGWRERLTHRTDLKTFVDYIDADEKRL
jgi:hypothetical protein